MKLRTSSRRTQAGSALLLTLFVGSIVGVSLAAILGLVHTQNRLSFREQARNYEITVAEAGVEEAFTQLYYASTNLGANAWAYSGGVYTKQRALGADAYYVATISNVNPPVIYSQGYVLAPNSTSYLPARTIRITTQSNSPFRRGLSARGAISMSGQVTVDSFDSANPLYSTAGRYDAAKAKDSGDVGTTATTAGALSVGGGTIFGHGATGPGGTITTGGGAVGSRSWIGGGGTGVQSGWGSSDMNASFPDVQAPFSSGASPTSGTVATTNYTYVLGGGNYILTSLGLSGQNKVIVNGNATLYVTGNFSMAGQSFIYIAPGGSLQVYVGGSTSLSGNGIMNTGNATNFFYYGLPSNTSLSLSGNAAFTGVIYAPSAAFSMSGGGNNTYDCVGAAVVGSVGMNGHFNFHYDEFLRNVGSYGGYSVSSWREL